MDIDIQLGLMNAFVQIDQNASTEEEKQTIAKHAQRVLRSAKNNIEEKDEYIYIEQLYQSHWGTLQSVQT